MDRAFPEVMRDFWSGFGGKNHFGIVDGGPEDEAPNLGFRQAGDARGDRSPEAVAEEPDAVAPNVFSTPDKSQCLQRIADFTLYRQIFEQTLALAAAAKVESESQDPLIGEAAGRFDEELVRFGLVAGEAVEHHEGREWRSARGFGYVEHPEDLLAAILECYGFLHLMGNP